MSLFQSLVMGLIQGLTEFLPISSSGHLVLAGSLLGIQTDTGILFEVALHLGTLISILIVFYEDIYNMIIEFFALFGNIMKKRTLGLKDEPYRVLLVMVFLGTVPTGIIGILFKDILERAFSSTLVVSAMLLITGTLLYIANGLKSGTKGPAQIKAADAVFIGLFQGLAITPGISRSGSTIFAGLLRGFTGELATKFSFILSIPAILGAALLQLLGHGTSNLSNEQLIIMVPGVIMAALSGTVAIKMLIALLNSRKLQYFSYYCWFIGLIGLIAGFLYL